MRIEEKVELVCATAEDAEAKASGGQPFKARALLEQAQAASLEARRDLLENLARLASADVDIAKALRAASRASASALEQGLAEWENEQSRRIGACVRGAFDGD